MGLMFYVGRWIIRDLELILSLSLLVHLLNHGDKMLHMMYSLDSGVLNLFNEND